MSKRKDYDSAVKIIQHIKRHVNFDTYKNCKLSNWQIKIFKLLMSRNRRQVFWVVDITGNRGKSWFCFFIMAMYSYFICDGSTDIRDLCFTLPDDFNRILFDVCRNMEKTFNYNSLQSVKIVTLSAANTKARLSISTAFQQQHCHFFFGSFKIIIRSMADCRNRQR